MERFTITELITGYKNKEFSPVDITKNYLKRIQATNDIYHSFITVTEEAALNQAKILEDKLMSGMDLGNLFGIPISFKDNIETKNIRTTNGAAIDRNYYPKANAKVVQQLTAEDAIMVGKTNLHEYAFGITSTNPHYGAVKNPWNPEYIPGGSSGGSAVAVAANQSVASIGTDTGGSVRIPAAACGITGLKPTNGKISLKGVTGISWTQDVVGPLAANMSDLALMMKALTGRTYTESCTIDIRGMRIGVPNTFFNENMEEEIYEFYLDALKNLEKQGAILIHVDLPDIQDYHEFGVTISISEAGYLHRNRIKNHINEYGDDVKDVMKSTKAFTALDYITALKNREEYELGFKALFEEIDVLATPTLPIPPQKIGVNNVKIGSFTEDIFSCLTRYNSIFNITGFPALSLPCGVTKNGLPIGFQLVGNKNNENTLIKTGYSYEQNYLEDFYRKREETLFSLAD